MYLLCLKAPEHITTKLTHVRNLIFRETGAVSALALDPVIPVSFHATPPPQDDFNDIQLPGNPFRTESAEIFKDSLFLKVNNKPYLKRIADSAGRKDIHHAIFNPFSGFYISEAGKNDNLKKITEFLKESGLINVTWNNGSLEVLEICFGNIEFWFNSFDWSTIWEQKIIRKP